MDPSLSAGVRIDKKVTDKIDNIEQAVDRIELAVMHLVKVVDEAANEDISSRAERHRGSDMLAQNEEDNIGWGE